MRKNKAHLESLYAKKWQEIWSGDKTSEAYQKLYAILKAGATRLRIDYGRFWKTNRSPTCH